MELVGREEALSALAQGLRAPGVLWVVGPPGAGKTALLREGLQGRPDVLWVPSQGDALDHLATKLGVEAIEAEVARRADELAATLVLDDVQDSDARVSSVCEALASRNTRAHWVLAGSSVSRGFPAGAAVHVARLSAPDVRALATRHRPHASEAELEAIVLAAGGSPARTKECVEALGRSTPGELRGVSEQAIRHLAAMSLSPARPLAAPPDPTQDEGLETLRRHLRTGAHAAALTLLEAHPSWIAAGAGEELWATLLRTSDPRYDSTKVRVASALHSRASLAWLNEQPRPTDPTERRLWVEALHQGGETQRAIVELRHLLEATTAAEARVDLQIQLAQAISDAGRPDRALRLLATVRPASETGSARHALQLARTHYQSGDTAASIEALAALRRWIPNLAPDEASAADAERRNLLVLLGHSAPFEDGSGSAAPRNGSGLRHLAFDVLRLAVSGRIGRSAALLASLRGPLPARGQLLVQLVSGVTRVIRGDYRGLPELSRDLVREAERAGSASLYHWAVLLERAVTLSRPHHYPELPRSETLPPPRGVMARQVQALRVCHAARRGEHVPPEEIPKYEAGDGAFMEPVCLLASATVQLLAGAPEEASFAAQRAAERAADHGYHFFRSEALLIQAYAELSAGRREALREALGALSEVVRGTRSGRYEVIHRLLQTALEARPDASCLLSVHAQMGASPTAARVASCLLGAEPGPDALDQMLLAGLSAAWDWRVHPLARGEACTWVIDPDGRRVHLPERSVTVSPQGVRVLSALFEHGGAASVEELARRAWGIEDFHQLRDSKRVHVALRRLRTQIETEASTPRWILTTSGGYAFAHDAPPGRLQRSS